MLRFDFYIPNKKLLIEYNGKQHYYSGDKLGWNTPEKHAQLVYRDNIKQQWCIKNDYNLHIIPYTKAPQLNKQYLLNILNLYPNIRTKDEVNEW